MTDLVLLPGMMCDARLFRHQVDALKGAHNAFVPDIGSHSTMADLAQSVLDTAPETFALLGLSLGGILAMEVINQAPERVSHLILMDTNPRAELDVVKAGRAPQILAAQNGDLQSVMRDEMKPRYLVDGPKKAAILDTCMEMALSLGVDVFVNQSLALRDRPDYQDTLKNVSCPTLIMCGEGDVLCPIERHDLMHSLIPHSQLEIIKHAGHLPTLEQPENVNQHILTFLGN